MSGDMKNLSRDVQERIRNVAYLMWESAGRQQNMALQYWLNAEREIFSSMQAATDVMMSARTQGQKAEQAPAQPSPTPALEEPQGSLRQDEEAAAQLPDNHPPLSTPKARRAVDAGRKAQTVAAGESPADKPATRRSGGRKKTTK